MCLIWGMWRFKCVKDIMEKSLITRNLLGGLGDQIFQIFTTISYALEHNINFFTKLYGYERYRLCIRKTHIGVIYF